MSLIAAICLWPYSHYLDHLAPLCISLDATLYTPDDEIVELAKTYYPGLDVKQAQNIIEIIGSLDVLIVTSRYWKDELGPLSELMYGRRPLFLYCPHGQSEKGSFTKQIEPFLSQEAVCIYGNLMREMIAEQNMRFQSVYCIGNHRARYYEKHRFFFDDLIQKQVQLDLSKKTIFYGPTWSDFENSSSFSQADQLIQQLPDQCNLIIKIHPLQIENEPGPVYQLIERHQKQENVQFFVHFPLVYPLLSLCDAYLGDASSIGYDFLYFEKPMYFFNTRGIRIVECGVSIEEAEEVFDRLECDFSDKQRWLYREAFDEGAVLTRNDLIASLGV